VGLARDGAAVGGVGLRATPMSPTWIWLQIAIVVFVVIGMIIAIVRLA